MSDQMVRLEKKNVKDSPLIEEHEKAFGHVHNEAEQIIVSNVTFWSRFSLRLSVQEKAIIAEEIDEEIQNKPLYWLQMIVSVVIATFGLLQNSVAIIIGGMLIAPMLKPIKGLAFGITTGKPSYFWRSFILMSLSIVIAVFTSYVVSLMVPLKVETTEILARTAPTLLDLFIAIAAGLIAILSMYFKKLSESIAGVAMAASILPPLAVTGIELALHNSGAMGGSFFLYLTNLFAILAVGVIIFMMYGFFPEQQDTKQRSIRVGLALLGLILFISFPLFSSLTNIADKVKLEAGANEFFDVLLEKEFPDMTLANLNLVGFEGNSLEFFGKLKVPVGIEFTLEDENRLRDELISALGADVKLEIEIVPVVRIGDNK